MTQYIHGLTVQLWPKLLHDSNISVADVPYSRSRLVLPVKVEQMSQMAIPRVKVRALLQSTFDACPQTSNPILYTRAAHLYHRNYQVATSTPRNMTSQ